MSARYALMAIAALVAVLAFAPSTRAQEVAGTCPAAVPLDQGGYGDALPGPLAIPDNTPTGAPNCMMIAGAQEIADLDVSLNITHTWVGDLIVTLQHADTGRTVVLMDRPGQPTFASGCDSDNVRATFSDENSDPVETQCNASPPAVYGFLIPEQALSAFDGESIAGLWWLTVVDAIGGDTGTLDSWSLLPTFGPVAANGDINCSTHTDAIDAALILQLSAGFNFPVMCPENGDVNANGQLDAIDAALILQYDAGLILIWPPPPPIL